MFSIKQPNHIIIGKNSAHEFEFPDNSLLITSNGAKSRGWIKYLNLEKRSTIFDQVENNQSMGTVNKILEEFWVFASSLLSFVLIAIQQGGLQVGLILQMKGQK